MAKLLKRQCPSCGQEKEFRSDQITCGCKNKPANVLTPREAYLVKEVARLNKQLDTVHESKGFNQVLMDNLMNAVDSLEPLPAQPYITGNVAEAEMAAVLKLSDFHTGAVVSADATEGFGEYNWAIEKTGIQYIAQKFLAWVEMHRKSFKIPKLFILSEGDMVSGDIHQELLVTNEFPAPVQAVNAGTLLAETVATLAPHFPEVHFAQVNIDNHSRLTKKLQFAEGDENSWQYVVHAIANSLLRDHKNINTIPIKGIRGIVNIQGINFLTEHGHTTKSWMGIPFYGLERLRGKEASKRMRAMLSQKRKEDFKSFKKDIGFDYMSIGHYHVPSLIGNDIIINGALQGTTEFDHSCGRYSPPAQVSFLVHPKYKLFDFVAWTIKR